MSLDLWNRDQIEIHLLQGFAYTVVPAAAFRWLLGEASIIVGVAVAIGVTAFWEIPQITAKVKEGSDYRDDIKDIVQRMIGSLLGVLAVYLLS